MTFIVDGTNGGTFPSWTTAGRPASPAVGQMGYNTTTGQFDCYTSNGWVTGITSTSPGNITLTSGGITFNANAGGGTQAVLSDFETGTWSPTVTSGGGSITSYSTTANYVKVGKLVYVSFFIELTSKGTISGEARMGGLPFTVTNNGVPSRSEEYTSELQSH